MKTKYTSMYRTLRFPVILLLAGSFGFATLQAQEEEKKEAEDIEILDEFEVLSDRDSFYRAVKSTTMTRIAADLVDTPYYIHVMTKDYLEDMGWDRIDEIGRYTGSMNSTENSHQNTFYMRGFTMNALSVNGIRAANGQEAGFINIERLEIIKGPSATYYGGANPGGLINKILKKPEFREGGLIGLKFGKYNFRQAAFDVQGLVRDNDTVGWRIVGQYTDLDDYREFENSNFQTIAASIRWRPNDKIELQMQYEYSDNFQNTENWGMWNEQNILQRENPPANIVAFFEAKGAADPGLFESTCSSYRVAAPVFDADTGLRTKNPVAIADGDWRKCFQYSWLNWRNWVNNSEEATGVRPLRLNSGAIAPLFPNGERWTMYPDVGNTHGQHFGDLQFKFSPTNWLAINVHAIWQDTWSQGYSLAVFPGGGRLLNYNRTDGHTGGPQNAQEVDVLFTKEWGGMEHKLMGGYKRQYGEFQATGGIQNFDQIAPIPSSNRVVNGLPVDPNRGDEPGTETWLVGSDVYARVDPFTHPVLHATDVFGGYRNAPAFASGSTSDQYYFNYRGSYFKKPDGDYRVHVMASRRYEKRRGDEFGGWAPSYGVVYKIFPNVSIFGNYQDQFRLNRASCLGDIGCRPEERDQPAANETNEGIDFGVKFDTPKLSGLISYFNIERGNIQQRDQLAELDDPRNNDADPLNNVQLRGLSGLWRSEGMDMDLIFTPFDNASLTMYLSYAYIPTATIITDKTLDDRCAIDTANNKFPGSACVDREIQLNRRKSVTPEHAFSLWTRYEFMDGGLKGASVALGFRHQGDNQATDNRSFRVITNEANTQYDMMLGYKFNLGGLRHVLKLNIENLSNETINQGNLALYADPRKWFFSWTTHF